MIKITALMKISKKIYKFYLSCQRYEQALDNAGKAHGDALFGLEKAYSDTVLRVRRLGRWRCS